MGVEVNGVKVAKPSVNVRIIPHKEPVENDNNYYHRHVHNIQQPMDFLVSGSVIICSFGASKREILY